MRDLAYQKIEKVNQAMFDISNAVNTTFNINELFVKIHATLEGLIDASIFFIATYDKASDTVSFPYYIDPVDERYYVDRSHNLGKEFSYSLSETEGSLTGMVIRSGRPVLMTREALMQYCQKHGCEPSGQPAEVWLGVPLQCRGQTIGVMAVQSYDNASQYSVEDIKIMSHISEQVAIAIERKRGEDQLIESENRYRSLVENITDIIYSTDAKGRIEFVSSPLEKITGMAPRRMIQEERWYRFIVGPVDSDVKRFGVMMDERDRHAAEQVVQRAVRAQQAFQVEYRMVDRHGGRRWVLERGHFFKNEDGSFQMEGIITDIQERKNSENQLRQREVLITALYEISSCTHTVKGLPDLYLSIEKTLEDASQSGALGIVLLDGSSRDLRLGYASHGAQPADLLDMASQVLAKNRCVNFPSRPDRTLLSPAISSHQGPCWIGVILQGPQQRLGVMLVWVPETDDECVERHNTLVAAVAEQVTLAIEFKQAEADLAASRRELIENAHRAGMADVATSTLHNVGNLLNGVNVAAGLMAEITARTKLPTLKRANDMLLASPPDLAKFLAEDPQGLRLRELYRRIEEAMSREFNAMREQIAAVSECVAAIQGSLESQQVKALSQYMEFKQELSETVQETLAMHSTLFDAEGVTVTQHFQSTTDFQVPKIKFVHLLSELLNNAVDSLTSEPPGNRQIHVSLGRHEAGVVLTIEDSGPGIDVKQRARVFAQGFSTRPDRRGSGLHMVANALTEMKGQIHVTSSEKLAGACFVIEFKQPLDE